MNRISNERAPPHKGVVAVLYAPPPQSGMPGIPAAAYSNSQASSVRS
jgi:hypothetical protein